MDVGFVFWGWDYNIFCMFILFSDEFDEYEFFYVFEFNFVWKWMFVIFCKFDEDGWIFLFCKGVDNVIFERLIKDNN